MKTISITDLQLIDDLKHLRQMDFIDPANANIIAPFLKIIGFDLDYPVQFVPSQHRNMQGKVVIGFQLVGEVECNDSFLKSSLATVEDRIIAASYSDLSLARKLQGGLITGRMYGEDVQEAFPPELVNPDEKEIRSQIEQLEAILLEIRGNPHKNDGSLKLWHEANIVENPLPSRRKKELPK
jgi:hypothetical protein